MKNLGPNQINIEYFELFFNLSMDMFCIAGSDGYFKHINSAWEGILGHSVEEMKSQPFINFVHPDDIEKTLVCTQESVQGQEVVSFHNRYRCKDGSYRHFRWASRKHPTEELIFAVARDITEEKKVEENLHREKAAVENQHQHVQALLSQVPAVSAVLRGPQYTFEFANEEYSKLIGNRNPVGLTLSEAVPGLDKSIFDILEKVYKTGERFSARDLVIEADWHAQGQRTKKYFNFVYSPLKERSGEVTGVWVLALEVTELKIIQERLQMSEKLAALGTMAAGVAHEVNNPLAFVMVALEGFSAQIEELSPTSSATKENILKKVQDCEDAIERIAEIVRSLKSFSRKDDGTIGLVDISRVIRLTVKFVENQVTPRAKLLLNLKDVPFVFGNEGKVAQVFINLLMNASQAIPEGRAHEHSISVQCGLNSSGNIEVTVADTGCGISPEIMNKIFEPFYTTKPVGVGTGLGLAISHGIISSMNGSIFVESEVGRGATFKIVLPPARPNQVETEKIA